MDLRIIIREARPALVRELSRRHVTAAAPAAAAAVGACVHVLALHVRGVAVVAREVDGGRGAGLRSIATALGGLGVAAAAAAVAAATPLRCCIAALSGVDTAWRSALFMYGEFDSPFELGVFVVLGVGIDHLHGGLALVLGSAGANVGQCTHQGPYQSHEGHEASRPPHGCSGGLVAGVGLQDGGCPRASVGGRRRAPPSRARSSRRH